MRTRREAEVLYLQPWPRVDLPQAARPLDCNANGVNTVGSRLAAVRKLLLTYGGRQPLLFSRTKKNMRASLIRATPLSNIGVPIGARTVLPRLPTGSN